MSSAVQTMQLQMERLQEEIANTLNTEKIRKTREHERAHLAKPNMEFMKGILDKTSALREYYDAEDPTMHWLHADAHLLRARRDDRHDARAASHSQYPDMIEFRERTTARKMELWNLYMALQRKDSSSAALTKELQEITAEEREIQERQRQEIANITTISGRTPPPQLLGNAPTETDIKFLESVYNMFNIQSEQIKTLEAEIQELKLKDV
jgi:hypothetical protein